MSGFILNDDQILEIKETLKNKKLGINKLALKYNALKNSLNFEAYGIEDIPCNNEYYDYLAENIVYLSFSWLTPLSKALNKNIDVNFEALMDVSPSGNIKHDNIQLKVSVGFFRKEISKAYILKYSRIFFKNLLPFRQFIKDVTFKGHGYDLKTIHFQLELDGTKVNPILRKSQVPNQQILSQWIATLDHIIDYHKGRYKFIANVPIVNGKMSTASFESAVCFFFEGRGV